MFSQFLFPKISQLPILSSMGYKNPHMKKTKHNVSGNTRTVNKIPTYPTIIIPTTTSTNKNIITTGGYVSMFKTHCISTYKGHIQEVLLTSN